MIRFKTQKARSRFFMMHPQLQIIACEMMLFCYERTQPFMITETRTNHDDDKQVGRVSSTHRTGRAFDIRTSHWTDSFREQFINHFTFKYWELGAFSNKTKERNVLVYHNHQGWHIHVQLDRRFSC